MDENRVGTVGCVVLQISFHTDKLALFIFSADEIVFPCSLTGHICLYGHGCFLRDLGVPL